MERKRWRLKRRRRRKKREGDEKSWDTGDLNANAKQPATGEADRSGRDQPQQGLFYFAQRSSGSVTVSVLFPRG
jgi:hypothetical protein